MKLEGEELYDAAATHWMKYVRPGFVMATMLGSASLLFLLPAMLVDEVEVGAYLPFFTSLTALTVTAHWGFQRLLDESLAYIVITSRRVILLTSSPLWNDVIREYHMQRIRAVEGKKEGFVQNIFAYGTLNIDTEGGDFQKAEAMHFIPNPSDKAQIIIAAIEQTSFDGAISAGANAQSAEKKQESTSPRSQTSAERISAEENVQTKKETKKRVAATLRRARKKLTGQ